MINFFNIHDIIHQRTYVDKPQQDDIVERKHQHILNTAHALKSQSSLPLSSTGLIWYLQLLTLSIKHHPHIFKILPLTNLYITIHPHTLIFAPLVASVLQLPSNLIARNLIQKSKSVHSLVIILVSRVKNFLISFLTVFLSLDVLFHVHIFPHKMPLSPSASPTPPLYTNPLWFTIPYLSSIPFPTSPSIPKPSNPSSPPTSSPATSPPTPLCRSTQIRKPSVHLKDYK